MTSRRLFALLLVLVGLYRLSLLDRGTSALVDETLYFTSVDALQSLARGDFRGAARDITIARSRQGAAILQMPIAALQTIPSAYGVPASNPRSLLIPVVFNVVLTLVTLYCFFRIAVALTGNEICALIAGLVYALLVNTNLYVRHLLTYDLSLCAAAIAMWLLVSRRHTPLLVFGAGLLAGAVIACYVGYYLLAFVIGAALVGQTAWFDGWRRAVLSSAIFTIGVATVIAILEVVCRAGGRGYFEASRAHARTISAGSFEEGWTFLPEYLIDVERLSGVVLLAGTAVWTARVVRRFRQRTLQRADWLILSAFAGWILQAVLSAELHRFVFYGRLIHPWMFFMGLALADALAAIDRTRLRILARGTVIAVSLISWSSSAWSFHNLSYPSDVLYALGIDTSLVPRDRMLCEMTPGFMTASPAPLNRVTRYPYTRGGDYLLVNFCQAEPSQRLRGDLELDSMERLYDGPHWQSFPAYTYEGFGPATRDELRQNAYRLQVYRTRESAEVPETSGSTPRVP